MPPMTTNPTPWSVSRRSRFRAELIVSIDPITLAARPTHDQEASLHGVMICQPLCWRHGHHVMEQSDVDFALMRVDLVSALSFAPVLVV